MAPGHLVPSLAQPLCPQKQTLPPPGASQAPFLGPGRDIPPSPPNKGEADCFRSSLQV